MRRLLALAIAAAALVVVPSAAGALEAPQSGPPDSAGRSAYCSVAVQSATYGGAAVRVVSVACQYGYTETTLAGVVVQVFGDPNLTGLTFPAATTGSYVVSQNGSGRYRATYSGPLGPSGTFTATQGWVRGILLERGTNDQQLGLAGSASGNGIDPAQYIPGDVASTFSVAPTATMPTFYWAGSAPGSASSTDFLEPGDVTVSEGDEDCGSWVHVACHFRNALRAAFVPDTAFVSDFVTTTMADADGFPLNLMGDVLVAVNAIRSDLGDALTGAGCYAHLLGAGNGLATPFGNFSVLVPTGVDGCAYSGTDAQLSSLFGYQAPLRQLLTLLLYLGVMFRVIRAFLPSRNHDLDPDPSY